MNLDIAARRLPIRVADQLAQGLIEQGVDRIFGIPGGAISPLYDALLDTPIRMVTCQHEAMAVYLASGYSRATGKPGVVLVTAGPGVLNAATPTAAALADEVPIVLITGEVSTESAGRGPLQDGGATGLDIAHVFGSLTRSVQTVGRPGRALAVLEEAFESARSHPRGPALIRLPMNVQNMVGAGVPVMRAETSAPQLPEAFFAHMHELLANAERPILFAGIGARVAGCSDAIRALAEWYGCPVITDLEARGVLPESHALHLGCFGVGAWGRAAAALADSPDLLITVGARLDDTTTAGWSAALQPGGMLIQLDHDPARLARAYDPDLAVLTDLRSTLERLVASAPYVPPEQTIARRARLAAVPAARSEPRPVMDVMPHHPVAVIHALQEVFGTDAIITADIGNHMLFAATHLRIEHPQGFHVANGLGGMTSGIGTALGFAIAEADPKHGRGRPVVAICGDGGALMGGTELATVARLGVPVVLVVLDNSALGMVEHGNQRVFGRSPDLSSLPVDFASLARSLGATGITARSRDDLFAARELSAHGPVLLHVPIDGSVRAVNPREALFAFPEGASGDDTGSAA